MPKIPKSKKHKKLKAVDPFNFKAQEQRRLNDCKNLPPKTNEQELPRAFKEIFMKNKSEDNAALTSPNKNKKPKQKEMDENEVFVKRKWENDKQFLNRIERETANFVSEQLMNIKYGLSEPAKSAADETKTADDLTINEKVLLRDKLKIKPRDNGKNCSSANSKSKKKKHKKKKKIDLLNLKDYVAFGERVDAPPDLIGVSKKLTKNLAVKKASKKDLSLYDLLPATEEKVDFDLSARNLRHVNDGTIKCADLRKKRLLTEERSKIIEAYRNAKKRKTVETH